MDQLPRLGQRELICLLLFTCNYVVFVWRGFFFLWVLGMGYVILLWHSLSLPYNYFTCIFSSGVQETTFSKNINISGLFLSSTLPVNPFLMILVAVLNSIHDVLKLTLFALSIKKIFFQPCASPKISFCVGNVSHFR